MEVFVDFWIAELLGGLDFGILDWATAGVSDWVDQGLEARSRFRARTFGRGGSGEGPPWIGIAGCLLALLGCVAASIPGALLRDESENSRFSIFTVGLILVNLLIFFLPQSAKRNAVRIIGTVCLIAGGSMAYTAFAGGSGTAASSLATTADENATAFTTEVAGLVSAAKPEWFVEVESPGLLLIIDRRDSLPLPYPILGQMEQGVSTKETAGMVVKNAPAFMEEIRQEISPEDLAAAKEAMRERYGSRLDPLPSAAPAAAVAATGPSRAVPPIGRADELIKEASAAWQRGDFARAVQSATFARNIRVAHLGANHAQVQEVDKMIAAAKAKAAGQ